MICIALSQDDAKDVSSYLSSAELRQQKVQQ